MTEEDAIKLIRTGGKAMDAGVKALYDIAAQPMLRHLVWLGASDDDAKDILQDMFIKIVKSAASFNGLNGQDSARAWMKRIAKNCLYDHFRKNKVNRLFTNTSRLEDEAGDDDLAANDEIQVDSEEIASDLAACRSTPMGSVDECVKAGLDSFSRHEPQRVLVLMMQMDGLSIDEIGSSIGRTMGATKEYLSQCKKKLQPYIAHCTDLLAA